MKRTDLLVEPFAGGASTSLRLVGAGVVERVLLADADPLVASFWQVAAADTENLIDRIVDEHSTYITPGGDTAIARWDYWRAWIPSRQSKHAQREAAVKCLFLNRTTFSGILHGHAGPIGGRLQLSGYGIGCRFNVEPLAERLRFVGHLYRTGRLVDVWCRDWEATLGDVPEWYPGLIPDRVIAYLDPPYLGKSQKLYQRSFDLHGGYAPTVTSDLEWTAQQPHLELAEYLRRRARFRWILSYDLHPALLEHDGLYAADQMTPDEADKDLLGVKEWRISKRLVELRYSASSRTGRGPADELLLTTLPPATVPADEEFRPVSGREP